MQRDNGNGVAVSRGSSTVERQRIDVGGEGSIPSPGSKDDPIITAVFYLRCAKAVLDAIPTGQLHPQARYDMQDELDRMVQTVRGEL